MFLEGIPKSKNVEFKNECLLTLKVTQLLCQHGQAAFLAWLTIILEHPESNEYKENIPSRLFSNFSLDEVANIPCGDFSDHCRGTYIALQCNGIPRNFVRGGSTNSVEDRGQKERESAGGSPLVRGSGGSCNMVQEISLHIVKFSYFLVL